ncbi:unnamed protein product [Meganyctiphanes norvegica]|uniref:Peptidase M14 domain-containing protein n=1 Tax=Meganyctiphanes norvegica TaxID=48144 RepID=A0AAV2R791_MEGNR
MLHENKCKWCSIVVAAALGIIATQLPIADSNKLLPQMMDYKEWTVLEITLENTEQKNLDILQLENQDIRPMGSPSTPYVSRIAVSPKKLKEVKKELNDHRLSFKILTTDLSRELLPTVAASREELAHGSSTYDRYMTFKEMENHIDALSTHLPNKVKHKVKGKTLEGHDIHLVTVSDYTIDEDKSVIFVEGGIHAREWISPAAAMNLIDHLVESPALTKHIEWHIMPVVNPDGYVYSKSWDRLWRKNRSGTWFFFCTGVDLNRNFGFHWAGDGASTNPCKQNYAGESQFSEKESKAVRDAVLEVKDRIEAYVTFHSYGQYIMYPWGHTVKTQHENHESLDKVGQAMAKAILTAEGKRYKVGPAGKVLYVASGASDDWVANVTGAPYIYTIELRDDGSYGFILPETKIQAGVNDAWVAMQVIAKEVMDQSNLRTTIPEDDPADLPAEPKKRRRRGCKGKIHNGKKRKRCRRTKNKDYVINH